MGLDCCRRSPERMATDQMKNKTLCLAAGALATIMLVLSSAPATAGQLEDAVAAYVRGDDETAVRLLRPLAEQGDARAQYHLGTRYFRGSGVAQDYAEALKWFRLSADQGNPDGQGALGSMYYMGKGVPQDYVLAHMWFNLSAARGGSAEPRDSISHQMTQEQIAEAQKLAREWRPGTHTAAPRCARSCAVARPMPRAPPVPTATWLRNSISGELTLRARMPSRSTARLGADRAR